MLLSSFVFGASPVVNDVIINNDLYVFDFDSLNSLCNASDGDDDTITYYYEWFKNGAKQLFLSDYYVFEDVTRANFSYVPVPSSWNNNGAGLEDDDYGNGDFAIYTGLSNYAGILLNWTTTYMPENIYNLFGSAYTGSGTPDYSSIFLPNSCIGDIIQFNVSSVNILGVNLFVKAWCWDGVSWVGDITHTSTTSLLREYDFRVKKTASFVENNTNLSYVSTSSGDEWILSCRAYDGSTSSDWVNSSAISIYDSFNNTFCFKDELNSNAIVNATISVEDPSASTVEYITNSSGCINFSVDSDFGNYALTFEEYEGYNTPIVFNVPINRSTGNVSQNFSLVNIYLKVNIYDRETYNLLNETCDFVLFDYLNATTTNGTILISNITIPSGDHIAQVLSVGFGTEQKKLTINWSQNITLNFYLLNLTGDNTGYLFVNNKDIFGRFVIGADDTLLEYNYDELAFISASECVSNSNGECQFLVELNRKTYMVSGSKTQNSIKYNSSKSINNIRRI